MIFLIIGLILGAVAVVFVLQNVVPITVMFFTWQIEGSLALILILSILTGAILAILSYMPEMISNYVEISTLKRRIQQLDAEADDRRRAIDELRKSPPTAA